MEDASDGLYAEVTKGELSAFVRELESKIERGECPPGLAERYVRRRCGRAGRITQASIALLFSTQRKYDRALGWLMSVLLAWDESNGPNALNSLNKSMGSTVAWAQVLMKSLCSLGMYRDALELNELALRIHIHLFGAESTQAVMSYIWRGYIEWMCGENSRSLYDTRLAFDLMESAYGGNAKKTLKIRHQLGMRLALAGNREEAKAFLSETVDLQRKKYGPHSRELFESKIHYGLTLRNSGSVGESSLYLKDVLKEAERTFRADDAIIQLCMEWLAVSLEEDGQMLEALEVIGKCVDITIRARKINQHKLEERKRLRDRIAAESSSM